MHTAILSQKDTTKGGAAMDYTTYPEGFEALIRDLDIPFTDEEERHAFFLAFIDSLIKQ